MKKCEIIEYLDNLKKMVSEREETPYSPYVKDILKGADAITLLIQYKDVETELCWVESVGDTSLTLVEIDTEEQDWQENGCISSKAIISLEQILLIDFEY